MKIWNTLKQPPISALKEIKAGRLKGMSDINPQWRYQAMTDLFGPCGIGWKFKIMRLWTEGGSEGQLMAFAEIHLFIKDDLEWSEAIPGIGGSSLVAKESKGLHTSDEAYKMAVTDALSVAMKMIGVASDIYMGLWDGSKYKDASTKSQKKSENKSEEHTAGEMTSKQWNAMKAIAFKAQELTENELVDMVKWKAEKESLGPRHWKITKFFIPTDKFEETFLEYSEYMLHKGQDDGDPPF